MARKQEQVPGFADEILRVLAHGKKSTIDIAAELGIPAGTLRRRCHQLKDMNLLSSHLTDGPRLLYCIDCAEVVTSATYESCREDEHEMRFFNARVLEWALTGKGLRLLGKTGGGPM